MSKFITYSDFKNFDLPKKIAFIVGFIFINSIGVLFSLFMYQGENGLTSLMPFIVFFLMSIQNVFEKD